jgi:uncharacterized damage-inducible protein DinB
MPIREIDLLAHMAWADAVALHAWAKTGTDHEELRKRWDHVAWVQDGFFKVMLGVDTQWDPNKPTPSFEELCIWSRRNHEAFADFSRGITTRTLARKVRVPWFPDPPCILTIAEALTQVALHTQHHRAQLMTRLVQLGHKAINVDYIIWIWKGRPEPRW